MRNGRTRLGHPRLTTDWIGAAMRSADDQGSPGSPPRRSAGIIGHQRRGTKERIWRNFGQPRRRAIASLRVMRLAERFAADPDFVDTPARIGARRRERGASEASSQPHLAGRLRVPTVVTVTGEAAVAGRWRQCRGSR
jgi:acetyl-CoA carboxylase alpha subunit